MFCPQQIDVEEPGRREPQMRRWVEIMARHGRGHVYTYPATFVHWVERKIICIDDYAYAGSDFRNNPDMMLSPGGRWDIDLVKKTFFLCFVIL